MSDVEKVARAILRAHITDDGWKRTEENISRTVDDNWRDWACHARAALSALGDQWSAVIEIYGIGTEDSPAPAVWYTDRETAEWNARDYIMAGAKAFIRTARATPDALRRPTEGER